MICMLEEFSLGSMGVGLHQHGVWSEIGIEECDV